MNKKLFKFSLVLCASVLMAVSCTKKDETPTKPDPIEVAVTLKNTKLSADSTTDAVLNYKETDKFDNSNKKTVTIELTGTDAKSLKAENVSIFAIIGQGNTWNNDAVAETANKIDLSAEAINTELKNVLTKAFDIAVADGTIILTAKNDLITAKVAAAIDGDNKAGMLKLVLKFNMTDRKEKIADVYVGLKRVS